MIIGSCKVINIVFCVIRPRPVISLTSTLSARFELDTHYIIFAIKNFRTGLALYPEKLSFYIGNKVITTIFSKWDTYLNA